MQNDTVCVPALEKYHDPGTFDFVSYISAYPVSPISHKV